MWVCEGTGEAFHLVCDVDADCDCYPAPVRCLGTWQCISETCFYFCDEG